MLDHLVSQGYNKLTSFVSRES